jgi:hypothetical protein
MDDSDPTTRRELLAGAGLAAAGVLAGCSSLDPRGGGTDCLTNVTTRMDGDGLREVRVEAGDPVTLVVELTDDEATLSEVEFLYVSHANGDQETYVPYRRLAEADGPDPPRTYEIPLQSPPHHEEYVVILDGVDDSGPLDGRTVSLSCS